MVVSPTLATIHSSAPVLALAVFFACAVEMVEAFTIVLAVGTTRGWRTSLQGAGAAVLTLAAPVALVGPALVHVPLFVLRVAIGGILLLFGLSWLRKAILRSSGWKARHDEDAIYSAQVAALSDGQRGRGWDSVGFAVAFKGVFLEGVEVVIIVITLGVTGGHLDLAIGAALAALGVVTVLGAVVARQLSGVPENALKMAVGLMVVSFGTFWVGEGIHVHWPGADAAILILIAFYGAASWLLVRWLRHQSPTDRAAAAEVGHG